MTEHMQHLNRNAGQPEFLAALKKIEALFEAGFDRKSAHGILKEKGILTMSYATFCRQFTRHKNKIAAPKTLGSGLAAESDRTRPLKDSGGESDQPPLAMKH